MTAIRDDPCHISFERIDNSRTHFDDDGGLSNIVFVCRGLNVPAGMSRLKMLRSRNLAQADFAHLAKKWKKEAHNPNETGEWVKYPDPENPTWRSFQGEFDDDEKLTEKRTLFRCIKKWQIVIRLTRKTKCTLTTLVSKRENPFGTKPQVQ